MKEQKPLIQQDTNLFKPRKKKKKENHTIKRPNSNFERWYTVRFTSKETKTHKTVIIIEKKQQQQETNSTRHKPISTF